MHVGRWRVAGVRLSYDIRNESGASGVFFGELSRSRTEVSIQLYAGLRTTGTRVKGGTIISTGLE